MRKHLFTLLAALALVSGTLATGAQAARPKSKHVVLIALDGWGAYSVPKADIPNIRSVMDRGCYTLKSRSILPSSSAPNWASMFMGVPTELHGYTQWGSRTPELPSAQVNGRHISPTIFSVVREQRPDAVTGCLYEWEGIKYLIDTTAVTFHAIAPDYGKNPTLLCEMAERAIREQRPALLAVCFDQLDHTGHADGHDTPAYYAKLKELDGYVGRILQAIDEAGIADETTVVMTADHGGKGKGHGAATLPEMEIPFIMAGRAVKARGEIPAQLMQYDTAAMLAYLCGVTPPPVWRGRALPELF